MKRIQPRIRGRSRQPLPACVFKEIWAAVDREARRHKVSRSWVIACIVGEYFHLDVMSYLERDERRRVA